MASERPLISVIGLGYVGLPLAVEFAKQYPVIGFDVKGERIAELQHGIDTTEEVNLEAMQSVMQDDLQSLHEGHAGLYFTSAEHELSGTAYYLVTVPTPIDRYQRPDLQPILTATRMVGRQLEVGATVVFESTVYPGLTEDECVPQLEAESGLRYNQEFWVGYSPERINPGDQQHKLKDIQKVTSGSTPDAAEAIDTLYRSIIEAGTFKAANIKVAEAAKVIENAQRDLNIAFVNELAKICHKIGIDTRQVLEAAGTKWNFLPFGPGLVGGHCIGVDPYYLAQKAQEVGHHPEIVLAGRRMNDSMGAYVASELVKLMIKQGLQVVNSRVLMLGITFKENTPDIRNTQAIDIIRELWEYDVQVDVCDPVAYQEEVREEFGFDLADWQEVQKQQYDGVVLAVGHSAFRELNVPAIKNEHAVTVDVKGFWPAEEVSWRL
jgi:UDP-N-acetyl-D-galactosamine dehydrogenase